jgi:hypothetical protein
MYSNGADEAKKWILAVAKMMNEDVLSAKDNPNPEKNDLPDEEDTASPFDILEKVRDIVNGELKDPDSNKEIEKILKKAAKELESFYEDDEEEDQDKIQPAGPPPQQQPQQPPQNQSSTGYNPNGGTGDIGAPGSDYGTMAGGGMNATPASGGQM